MYSHPAYVAMQLADRYEANLRLAKPTHTGGGTPLLARLASIARHIRPVARPSAPRPSVEPARQI